MTSMEIATRLCKIEQEMKKADEGIEDREYTLGLFWEHMPCILDPIEIRDRMLFLKRGIDFLKKRKVSLRQERDELFVRLAAATVEAAAATVEAAAAVEEEQK